MISPNLLVTSFTTWKPEQISNSSDDLLTEIHPRHTQPYNLNLLRRIPVDFQKAPAKVLQAIQALHPDAVICCGMGENRPNLYVEIQAVWGEETRQTTVNVNWLLSGLSTTEVSYDAGQFVCNRLYFETLSYLQFHPSRVASPPCPCIFVHVPVLTEFNRDRIIADFLIILQRMHWLAAQRTASFGPLSA